MRAIVEYLLWCYLIAWPIYIYLTHQQEKQSVIAKPDKLIAVYRITMLHLWLPTTMLLFLLFNNEISSHDIGLKWHWGLANQIGVAGLILLIVYSVVSIKQFKDQPEKHKEMRKQLGFIQWFMPTTIKESRYFIIGLSVSAGVCEELLYRGYLIHIFTDYLPTYGAVIISSIAFGLGHIYQGAMHVVRAALLGVVMALIYLATDSIIIPIILHTLMDMNGGAMAYIVFRKKDHKMVVENAL